MKVNPNNHQFRWKTGFLHAFLTIILMVTVACDFDIPEKFEMPTWYLDLKIPLVQTRYQMADISDSSAGIFLTDDSLGFKIIQEGEMPATELPDLPSVPLGLEQAIASGEISGISMDIELPEITISQRIDVVAYGQQIYPDTTDLTIDTSIFVYVDPFTDDSVFVDTTIWIAAYTPFAFPDTVSHVLEANHYDSLIVVAFNGAMDLLSSALDTTIDLGLSSIPLPDDPPIIASVDTLIIASHATNSVYRTLFKNNGIPTDLVGVYSRMVAGSSEPLSDTLANHNQIPSISQGVTYADTTDLSGKGLTSFLKMATNMSLSSALTDYVTIPPGSLYVDFNITFKMAGIDSIDVTTNNYSMSDGIEMPPMELPEMDMSESGISKMEIYRNVLKNEGTAYNENKLIIRDLASSFPFDMNFLLNFQNFSPTPDGDSVKIDTVLKNGIEINKTFDLPPSFYNVFENVNLVGPEAVGVLENGDILVETAGGSINILDKCSPKLFINPEPKTAYIMLGFDGDELNATLPGILNSS